MKCQFCNSNKIEVFQDGVHGYCHSCGKMVPLIREEQNEPMAMQIFFSYGHDNHSVFVTRLAERIEEKTKGRITVWIDRNRISWPMNWRSEITEGICNSYAVMAFLSSYSTREQGPCLDELAIAIASKHGMIKSVLLEREGRFTAPAQTREYQWADMSDYPSYLAQGGAVWDEYIDARADQVIRMLDSNEVHQYNSELQLLRRKLLLPEINSELSKFDHLINKEMFGREWLIERINAWISDPEAGRILLLYGKPGSGKSTFAAHLQHYNTRIAASLACDFQSDEFSDQDRILVWIAYKLAMRIHEYRTLLLRIVTDEHFRMGRGKDRFNRLLLKPLGLCNISGKHERMILLIDALDEAAGHELMWFIRDYAEDFAPWFRFLITSRREQDIEACFAGCTFIDISLCDEENGSDVRMFLNHRLEDVLAKRADKTEFMDRLVKACEGNFAYAECISESIRADLSEDPDLSLEDYPLPAGLHSLFRKSFDRKEFVWFDRNGTALNFQGFWQRALGLILASPKPIPIDTLKRMMEWGENEYQGFRRPLSVLLSEKNGCLTVFHKSLADWLASPEAGEYYTSEKDGKRAFADSALRLYECGIRDDFAGRYLLVFLLEIGNRDELERLRMDRELVGWLFDLEAELINISAFDDSIPLCLGLQNLFQDAEDEYGLCRYRDATEKMGSNHFILEDYTEAFRDHNKALELSKRLMREYPDEPRYKLLTAVSLKQIADVYQEEEQYETACAIFQESAKLLRELAKVIPEDNKCLIELSNVIARIAHAITLNNPGKMPEPIFREVIDLYEESLQIRRAMFEKAPFKPGYLHRITIPQFRMAEVYESAGDDMKAKQLLEECLDVRERLVKEYPQNPRFQSFLAQALENAIFLMRRLGETERMKAYYEECLSLRRKMVREYPQSVLYRHDLERFEKAYREMDNHN